MPAKKGRGKKKGKKTWGEKRKERADASLFLFSSGGEGRRKSERKEDAKDAGTKPTNCPCDEGREGKGKKEREGELLRESAPTFFRIPVKKEMIRGREEKTALFRFRGGEKREREKVLRGEEKKKKDTRMSLTTRSRTCGKRRRKRGKGKRKKRKREKR